MSKTATPPKLKIYNKNPGTISTGANTVVELDGNKLPLVSFLKLEIKPRGVAKLTVEMYVDVDVEIEQELLHTTTRTLKGDSYPKYVLAKYEAVIPAQKR